MLFELVLGGIALASSVTAAPFLYKKYKELPDNIDGWRDFQRKQALLENNSTPVPTITTPPSPPSFPLPYHVMRKYLAIANTFPKNMTLYNWLKEYPEHVEAIQLWNDFLNSTVNLNLIFPEDTWEDTQQYLADHHRQFFSVFVPELVQTYDKNNPDPIYHRRIQSICYRTHIQLVDAYKERNESRSAQSIQLLEMASQEANGVPLLQEPIQVDADTPRITSRPAPKPYPMLTTEDIKNYKV